MKPKQNAKAYGSHGVVFFDPDTGDVNRVSLDDREPPDGLAGHDPTAYANIVRFDVEEWRRTYPDKVLDDVDILDIGYWTTDGEYAPPEYEWRREFRPSHPPTMHPNTCKRCGHWDEPSTLDAAGVCATCR